ncbi:MAG: hypothetical protein JWN79_3346, partial [Gemmatimonadetes bacterium]|nr:hypothetical protein [Gemmatimonadota bacterium]
MMQVAARAWPAGMVHDTVAAVLRTAPFRRSAQSTMLERILAWLVQGLEWLARYLEGVPGGRTAVIWVAALVAVLIAARLLL